GGRRWRAAVFRQRREINSKSYYLHERAANGRRLKGKRSCAALGNVTKRDFTSSDENINGNLQLYESHHARASLECSCTIETAFSPHVAASHKTSDRGAERERSWDHQRFLPKRSSEIVRTAARDFVIRGCTSKQTIPRRATEKASKNQGREEKEGKVDFPAKQAESPETTGALRFPI
ncbi:hypothetical protein EVAR_82315_1, partial [Eumeta japonica]